MSNHVIDLAGKVKILITRFWEFANAHPVSVATGIGILIGYILGKVF